MNHIKSTLLLSLLTVLIILMGSAAGGKAGIIFAFFMVLAMSFFSFWFSGKSYSRCTAPETSTATAAETPIPFKYQHEN